MAKAYTSIKQIHKGHYSKETTDDTEVVTSEICMKSTQYLRTDNNLATLLQQLIITEKKLGLMP